MSVENLINLFEHYGWSGIVAVLCVIFVQYFITKKDKKSVNAINDGFTKMTDIIVHQNDSLVTAITQSNEKTQKQLFNIISQYMDDKDKKKRQLHNDSLAKRNEIGKCIDEILFDILQIVNAQRVVMIEFHNSKENLDGLSFLWYDIQHEKQQKGIKSISQKARNIQATNIRPIINRVNENPQHICVLHQDDIESIYNESTVLYSYLKELNVAHLIYLGVYNTTTNNLSGIVGIEWQEGQPYHNDIVDYYLLKEKAGQIEHLYNQARIELEEQRNDLSDRRPEHII